MLIVDLPPLHMSLPLPHSTVCPCLSNLTSDLVSSMKYFLLSSTINFSLALMNLYSVLWVFLWVTRDKSWRTVTVLVFFVCLFSITVASTLWEHERSLITSVTYLTGSCSLFSKASNNGFDVKVCLPLLWSPRPLCHFSFIKNRHLSSSYLHTCLISQYFVRNSRMRPLFIIPSSSPLF